MRLALKSWDSRLNRESWQACSLGVGYEVCWSIRICMAAMISILAAFVICPLRIAAIVLQLKQSGKWKVCTQLFEAIDGGPDDTTLEPPLGVCKQIKQYGKVRGWIGHNYFQNQALTDQILMKWRQFARWFSIIFTYYKGFVFKTGLCNGS